MLVFTASYVLSICYLAPLHDTAMNVEGSYSQTTDHELDPSNIGTAQILAEAVP